MSNYIERTFRKTIIEQADLDNLNIMTIRFGYVKNNVDINFNNYKSFITYYPNNNIKLEIKNNEDTTTYRIISEVAAKAKVFLDENDKNIVIIEFASNKNAKFFYEQMLRNLISW